VRDLRELQRQTGSRAKRKYVNIYIECVTCSSALRNGSGTEACLSARRDGAGVDNSGSECLTVAHTRAIVRAEREQKRTMFLFLACNWVILCFCSNYYMIYIVIKKCDLLSQKERDCAVTIMKMKKGVCIRLDDCGSSKRYQAAAARHR